MFENFRFSDPKLQLLYLKARFGTRHAIDELRYKSITTPEERKIGSNMAEAFTGEALDFLKDGMTGKLAPLHPTREQLGIFQFLMSSIDNESLGLVKTQGQIWADNRPFMVKEYRAKEDYGVFGKNVCLITRWGLCEPFPHGFAVFGNMGLASPRSIDFITLPMKASEAGEVRKVLGFPEKQNGFTQKIGVYGKGEYIMIEREGVLNGDDISMTERYYLVGAFDGMDTGKTYWLYGCNQETQSQISVSKTARASARIILQPLGNF